jgi:SAM-dependent methyltransferase
VTAPRPLHSLEHFGVARHYFWNYDFVALMSQRWRLERVTCALDVGCGVGHWTAVLGTLLLPGAQIVGVDREEAWIAIAREAHAESGSPRDTRFVQGLAEALPFPDNAFDMVTCQTLLLHLPEPLAALREMHRVLQPGGLLAVIEPNNAVQALVTDSLTAGDEVEEALARVRLRLRCERGRRRLGEGDFSVGDRVPAMVAALGFRELAVHQSDKTLPLVVPYATEEQAALREEQLGETAVRWVWGRADASRYFAADGGTDEEFAPLWAAVERDDLRERQALEAQTFARPGGRLVYVVSARK